MPSQKSTLLTRMYGSVENARAAWAQQALRAEARQAARQYCRQGQRLQIDLLSRRVHRNRGRNG